MILLFYFLTPVYENLCVCFQFLILSKLEDKVLSQKRSWQNSNFFTTQCLTSSEMRTFLMMSNLKCFLKQNLLPKSCPKSNFLIDNWFIIYVKYKLIVHVGSKLVPIEYKFMFSYFFNNLI